MFNRPIFRALVITVIFAVIIIQFALTSYSRLNSIDGDFAGYYYAAQQLTSGENPYKKIGRDIFRNPPPALFFFVLLPLLPINTSQVVWFFLSLTAFIGASYMFIAFWEKTFGKILPNIPRWQLGLVFISLSLLFFPLRYNVSAGQINTFLFLLIVISFVSVSSGKLLIKASIPLAIASILKITPLFFLYTLFLEKKYKLFALTVFTILISFVITVIFLGKNIFLQYLAIPGTFLNFSITAYYNQSLTAFLTRAFHNPYITEIIVLLLLGLYMIFLYKTFYRKIINIERSAILWSLSTIGMLLFSPFAWQYHFVICIFPLLVAFFLGYYYRAKLLYFVLLLTAYLLLGVNIKAPALLTPYGIAGAIILSHYVWGLLILSGILIYADRKYCESQ